MTPLHAAMGHTHGSEAALGQADRQMSEQASPGAGAAHDCPALRRRHAGDGHQPTRVAVD